MSDEKRGWRRKIKFSYRAVQKIEFYGQKYEKLSGQLYPALQN